MWFGKRDRKWRSTLREFIYLDEVSVTSLLAARDGEIPASVTDTLTRSAAAETRLTGALSPSKELRLGAEAHSSVTDTSSREVVRRAVIQSTFRRLHKGGDRKQRPFSDGVNRNSKFDGKIRSSEELRRRYKRLEQAGVVKKLDAMSRGDLLEIEVTLRPAKTFIAGHALESLDRIMSGRPQLFGDASHQIAQTVPIAEVLNDLMVGLVPIHGVASKTCEVTSDGETYLLDYRIIGHGTELEREAKPVHIAAQTDVASYWKDLRRILYNGSRYTVYARLAAAEVQHDWTSLKLNELLKDMSVELGDAVASLEEIVETQFDTLSGGPQPALDGSSVMNRFADSLPGEVPADQKSAIETSVARATAAFQSAEGLASVRAAFDIVIDAHERATGEEVDRLTVSKIRSEVTAAGGTDSGEPGSPATRQEIEPQGLLEVEVIAIYW